MTTRCALCGRTLDPHASSNWRRIQGWERKAHDPTRKSGSDIALREPVGEDLAHDHCIGLAKSGIHVGQGSLV